MESLRTYEDFLSDENFVLWRLTRETGLEEYWQKFITENPDKKVEFTKAASLVDNMKPRREVLSDEDKKDLLNRIKTSARILSRRRKIRRWSLSAACLLLVMATPLIYKALIQDDNENTVVGHVIPAESIVFTSTTGVVTFDDDLDIIVDRKGYILANDTTMIAEPADVIEESWNTLVVPYGRRSKITLTDGSQVWVNSGSSVSFPTAFTGATRQIEVTGEVYLDVISDRGIPFVVHSPEFEVRVYGTSFNLSAFEGKPGVVVLAEGKIAVKPSGREEIEVNPSEKLEITTDGIAKEKVDVRYYTSWKDGYLIFNDTSMEEVLIRIGRYYNIAFDTGARGLDHIKCFGNLYLSTDLVNVMHTVSILSSSQFSQKGKTYYLKFDGKDESI